MTNPVSVPVFILWSGTGDSDGYTPDAVMGVYTTRLIADQSLNVLWNVDPDTNAWVEDITPSTTPLAATTRYWGSVDPHDNTTLFVADEVLIGDQATTFLADVAVHGNAWLDDDEQQGAANEYPIYAQGISKDAVTQLLTATTTR